MEEQLQEYGLSQKEAHVYLSSLKLGATTAQRISAMTDLRRSTTYDVLEMLKAKGLMTSFIRGKKHYFEAVEPKELLALLRSKEERLKSILPQLESLKHTSSERPTVELYEGTKGVLSMLEEIYNEEEILVYGSAQKAHAVLKHVPESLARRRIEKGILLKAVFERSTYATFRVEEPKMRRITHLRFLESMRHMPSVTFIAGNQVALITLENELTGIRIVNTDVSKTQRLVFESFWRSAR